MLLVIPAGAAIFLIGHFLTEIPFLNVSAVSLNGPINSDAAQQIKADLKGKNILSLSDEEIRKEVAGKANVMVKGVEKKLPGTIDITVTAAQAVLSWQSSKGRFLVDGAGNVYAAAGAEQIPQVSSPLTDEAVGSKINTSVANLITQLSAKFTVLTAAVSDGTVQAHLSTGQDVFFDAHADVSSEIDALQLITAKAKIDGRLPRVVDLRFSKPVVTF